MLSEHALAIPSRRRLLLSRLAPVSMVVLVGLAGLSSLAGCSMFKPSPITEVQLKAVAAANVNPDGHKRPSPIVIRVYELQSRAQFESLDFISLSERDKDALGADLLSREEFVMRPGEAKALTKKVSPEARYIGITAGYRDLERAQWRAITAIQGLGTTDFNIKVDALAVSISAQH